jgi:hypothetical protein
MAFCFFASSFCITLLLAAFLAATAGILFWGWLWGLMGILLAVPLTAFVKIVADCHPSLIHVSNLLAESPRPIPSFIDSGRDTIYKTVPFIRKGFPAKVKLWKLVKLEGQFFRMVDWHQYDGAGKPIECGSDGIPILLPERGKKECCVLMRKAET